MSAAVSHRAEATLERYEAIMAHAELELELAGRGELQQLTELGESWEELVAGLPATPPVEAASLLMCAKLIHERTHIELIRLREKLLGEVSQTTQAQRAADGYAPKLGARPRLSRRA
jgi:hypothetical protein